MYTIVPLALALTAVAAPWGPNGGAGSRWGFQGLDWLPVAGGAHALPGSHAHGGGLPGGAGKAQVPRVSERGFAVAASGADATDASASAVEERGLAADATDADASASTVEERGFAVAASGADTTDASASAVEERGVATDATAASAVQERGMAEITAADETDASAVQE